MFKRIAALLLACLLPICSAAGEIVPLPIDDTPGLAFDFEKFGTENGYEDPSLSIALYEGKMEDTEYLYAMVKIADPSQLRSALAYKVYSSRNAKPERMTEMYNAVFAVNADFCNYENNGYLVRQGKFYYNHAYKTIDTLLIDQNGDFHAITTPTRNSMETWIAQHPEVQVVNSFNFGPALIIDGERAYEKLNTAGNASVARGHLRFARTVLCQLEGELSYLVLCCQGDQDGKGLGFTYEEIYDCLRQIEREQGVTVRVAYNLDGGYSSAMLLNNQKINWPENGVNRELCDIVYFASAWQEE